MAATNAEVNLGITFILSLSGLLLMLGSHLYPKLFYRVANYTLWKVGFMQFSLLVGNKEQDLENETVSAIFHVSPVLMLPYFIVLTNIIYR